MGRGPHPIPLRLTARPAAGVAILEPVSEDDLPENLFDIPGYPQTGMADRLPDVEVPEQGGEWDWYVTSAPCPEA